MPNIRHHFNDRYLRADDIDKPFVATIEQLADVVIGDDERILLLFSDCEKELPLNKTNALAIADLYGDETDNWVGKQIEIHKERVMFKGKRVASVRVRRPPQPQPQPKTPAEAKAKAAG